MVVPHFCWMNINHKYSKTKIPEKYLDLTMMNNLEYHITRNFVVYAGHLVLLEQRNAVGDDRLST
jgi:hypothetical protein